MNKVVWAKLLALLLSVMTILLIEFICRVTMPASLLNEILSFLEVDNKLLWIQRPNQHRLFFGGITSTDQFGLRNPQNHITDYSADEIRILILGASPSFGWGVNDENTYARLLEKMLQNKIKRKIKVINASVIGYSSYQGLLFLKEYYSIFRPHYIVASYGINDISTERFFFSNAKEDHQVETRLTALQNIFTHSAIFKRLSDLLVPYRNAPLTPRVSLINYIKNHEAIITLAKKEHVPVVFLIIPFEFPNESMRGIVKRGKEYFEALYQLAKENSVPVVDVSSIFSTNYSNYYLISQNDHIHPNEEGHRHIAQKLFVKISQDFLGKKSH